MKQSNKSSSIEAFSLKSKREQPLENSNVSLARTKEHAGEHPTLSVFPTFEKNPLKISAPASSVFPAPPLSRSFPAHPPVGPFLMMWDLQLKWRSRPQKWLGWQRPKCILLPRQSSPLRASLPSFHMMLALFIGRFWKGQWIRKMVQEFAKPSTQEGQERKVLWCVGVWATAEHGKSFYTHEDWSSSIGDFCRGRALGLVVGGGVVGGRAALFLFLFNMWENGKPAGCHSGFDHNIQKVDQ